MSTNDVVITSQIVGCIVLIVCLALGVGWIWYCLHEDFQFMRENLSGKIEREVGNIKRIDLSNIKQEQKEIKQIVISINDNLMLIQDKQEILYQQVLDIKQTSDRISALVDLLYNTQIKNTQLKQENQTLKQQLRQAESQFNQGR